MTDEIDLRLGRRLRRRRRLLGMTQQELGALCGVRFQQVQKWETAACRMYAGTILKLAGALGVSPAYFFDGLESPSPADAATIGRASWAKIPAEANA